MKYIPSIAFEEMSGSAKGVTAAIKNSKRQRNEQRNCRTIEEALTQRIRPLEGQLSKEK